MTVLEVPGGRATVQIPDTSVEKWSLASLPGRVLPSDRVGVQVDRGDLEVVLPRLAGLRA